MTMTNSNRWLTLTVEQRQEILRRHAERLKIYAEAKRWVKAHPSQKAVNRISNFGSLNAIPDALLDGPLR